MNFEQARMNMIEQQIRPWEVLDQAVLDAIARVPREEFVPERFRKLAFSDTRIPLEHGQSMMVPKVEARMLQALALRPEDSCLEIGTGSAYVTALLAELGGSVQSVDLYDDFVDAASTKIGKMGFGNVTLSTGDGSGGWEACAPYDVIALTASVPYLPDGFKQQLKDGGRLFVIVGQSPVMEAQLITRVGKLDWRCESLFETELPAMIGLTPPETFRF